MTTYKSIKIMSRKKIYVWAIIDNLMVYTYLIQCGTNNNKRNDV